MYTAVHCCRDHKKRRGTKEDPDWGELNPRKNAFYVMNLFFQCSGNTAVLFPRRFQ